MDMTTCLELALFILATAFLIISFFIVDGRNRSPKNGDAQPEPMSPEQLAPVREGFVSDLGRESAQILQDCEDRLEKLSNDKIIAVGEYSDQILQKIDSNHNEVVFMYEMLQKKEEELKAEAMRLDDLRIRCEQAALDTVVPQKQEAPTAIERLTGVSVSSSVSARSVSRTQPDMTGLSGVVGTAAPDMTGMQGTAAMTALSGASVSTDTGSASQRNRGTKAKQTVRPEQKKQQTGQRRSGIAAVAVKAPGERIEAAGTDTSMIGRNDEIIALYKSNRSVMEISKLMGMGQGEVKLIIDLYCR